MALAGKEGSTRREASPNATLKASKVNMKWDGTEPGLPWSKPPIASVCMTTEDEDDYWSKAVLSNEIQPCAA
jgi:hypothetical protein